MSRHDSWMKFSELEDLLYNVVWMVPSQIRLC